MPIETPSQQWREQLARETQQLEAGEISADDCFMAELFPVAFIDRTEALLAQYRDAIAACATDATDHARVMLTVKTLVLALNQLNVDFDHCVIETSEREELCAYIDAVVIERGIDIEALAASQKVTRWELTDEWRDW